MSYQYQHVYRNANQLCTVTSLIAWMLSVLLSVARCLGLTWITIHRSLIALSIFKMSLLFKRRVASLYGEFVQSLSRFMFIPWRLTLMKHFHQQRLNSVHLMVVASSVFDKDFGKTRPLFCMSWVCEGWVASEAMQCIYFCMCCEGYSDCKGMINFLIVMFCMENENMSLN